MSDDIAIKVDGVSKNFRLPHQKADSIKSLFTGFYKKNTKKYTETQHALKDINFEIKEGEFFGIVGRNGSGKSTLLKILAGIYQPTKGGVTVKGKLVPFIELGVGFDPELTGRENVYLNGALLGFDKKRVDSMYDDIVSFAELEKFMDQKLKNYSSGMQVRLAFSMATRSDADILLIDEVLAVGDADFQRKCFEYFKSLKRNKKTVVFVSHDMEAVREYCDRCVFIDKSEIIDMGDPDAIAEKYTQLFNNVTQQADGKAGERWGDKAARFSSVKIKKSEKCITITGDIKFNKTLESPIIGVLIKNSTGNTVCGTNSKILRQKTGEIKSGSTIKTEWTIPNLFSNGNYEIDVAVTYSDGITQADWWHNAARFQVYDNKQSTPHIVSPEIEMKLN